MVLVLWGQGFDEIAAAIFIGELRRAGIRVKLVGLNSRQFAGQHGLALVPDIPLEQAMRKANEAICVIIPAPFTALKQFSYDPRVAELLRQLASSHALLVVDCLQTKMAQANTLFSWFPATILEYPAAEALIPFVQTVLSPQLKELKEKSLFP